MPGVRGIFLQFSSQLRNVSVDRAADDGVGVTPHLAHELQARNNRAPAPHEREKKLVLLWSDLDDLAGPRDGSGGEIDLDVAEPLDRGRRRPRRAGEPGVSPQQRLDTREDLEDAEGFRHVVVRAELQSADLVGLLSAGRQDQDRHRELVLADRLEDAEPVETREHQVEDDEVGPGPARALEPRRAVARDLHLVALDLEVVAQAEGEIGVVLDEKNAAHAAAPPGRLLKKGAGVVASAVGPDARRRDEGDAGAHRRGATTPQTVPRDFRLRRSRCDRQPRDSKGPRGLAPVLTLSAAVREANACGRKLDTTPASILQQPATGSVTTNRQPPTAPSFTKARPPWRATISATTARRMPAPPFCVSRSPSSRTNFCQTRSRSRSGIPGPSSSTESRTASDSRASLTRISWPAGPYLTALSRRFKRTCLTAPSSIVAKSSLGSSAVKRTWRASAS